MSVQPEKINQEFVGYRQLSARERAQRVWEIGKATRTLVEFAELSDSFPPRDDAAEEFHDIRGNVILGYN